MWSQLIHISNGHGSASSGTSNIKTCTSAKSSSTSKIWDTKCGGPVTWDEKGVKNSCIYEGMSHRGREREQLYTHVYVHTSISGTNHIK